MRCCHRHGPLFVCSLLVAATACAAEAETPSSADFSNVPGVIINYSPAASGIYIGSPSIAVLPNGDYVASHDEFGPQSTERERAISRVFGSSDRGETWSPLATIDGQFWSTLFHHGDALYLIGTWKHHGNLIIRRSTDGGRSWSEPTADTNGLLAEGEYHCAPQPVLIHDGRLWRAMEDAAGGTKWGERYRPFMISAPIEADLLQRENWTFSNYIALDKDWLDGRLRGWLEGNAVVNPEGNIVNILRVAGSDNDVVGKAAMLHISNDGKSIEFDPEQGFIDLPGGCKKFTIRHDPETDRYWSLVNWVRPEFAGQRNAGGIRNTLAVVSSQDLRDWRIERVVLRDPDLGHGYQYPDWLFDGDDMIAAVRTATDDSRGGPHNYHDANFLTFHRIENFRQPEDTSP